MDETRAPSEIGDRYPDLLPGETSVQLARRSQRVLRVGIGFLLAFVIVALILGFANLPAPLQTSAWTLFGVFAAGFVVFLIIGLIAFGASSTRFWRENDAGYSPRPFEPNPFYVVDEETGLVVRGPLDPPFTTAAAYRKALAIAEQIHAKSVKS